MMNTEMNTMVLDNKELDQIDGGRSVCLFVGVSLASPTTCYGKGTSSDGSDEGTGLMACALFGLGYGMTK